MSGKKLRELKVGDEIGGTGFVLSVALPDRRAVLSPRSPAGGELAPHFEAQRMVEGGRVAVRQSAGSIEDLAQKCGDWVLEQSRRKDGGSVKHLPVRVRVGMLSRSAAPQPREAA